MKLYNLRLDNFQGKQFYEANFGGMDAKSVQTMHSVKQR